MQLLPVALRIYYRHAVKHEVGTVCFKRRACRRAVLAVKPALQNVRRPLFPGTCAL